MFLRLKTDANQNVKFKLKEARKNDNYPFFPLTFPSSLTFLMNSFTKSVLKKNC